MAGQSIAPATAKWLPQVLYYSAHCGAPGTGFQRAGEGVAWGLVVARASDGEGLAVGPMQMDLLADIRRKLPALSHRRL